MSGHSKWATIKHKKAANDKARGKLFAKVLRQVEVAAREGGGDQESNPTLRTMFQKARDNSIPLDTIERAVKRGTGELEGVTYEQVTYEGYAPGGVAVLAECLTDNRNRAGSEIRSIFTRNGGSLAEPGAVNWQFSRVGHLVVPRSTDEEELMLTALDAGATDVDDKGENWRVTCPPSDLHQVREALEAAGITVELSEATMVASTAVPLASVSSARSVLNLIDALDDHDDVGSVYANYDIPDSVFEDLAAAT